MRRKTQFPGISEKKNLFSHESLKSSNSYSLITWESDFEKELTYLFEKRLDRKNGLQSLRKILSKFSAMDFSVDPGVSKQNIIDALSEGINSLIERNTSDIMSSGNAEKETLNLSESASFIPNLIKLLPIAVYTCDREGRILFYNEAAVKLWGREPETGKDLWCGSWKIYDSHGNPVSHESCPMAIALKEGRAVRDMEIVVRCPDGTLHNILPHPTPVFNDNGHLTGAFNVLLDITKSRLITLEKDLTVRLNQIFNRDASLEDSICSALEVICQFMDKRTAEAWITTNDASQLKLLCHYSLGKRLRYSNETIKTFRRGEGLFGKAFMKRSPVFMDKKELQKDYSRKNAAFDNDLESAMAVPVILHDEIIAVITFYDDKRESNKIKFNELSENIIAQLAVNIQRKKTEEEHHHFFNLSNDILCHLGPNGFFTKVNPAFCKALGYTEEELLDKPYSEFIHPEDSLRTQLAAENFLKGRPPMLLENRYITKQGEIKWLAWMATPVLSGGLVFAVAKDITDKKNAELQVAAYSNRISAILESITDGFFALDKDWIVTYWNKEAERTLAMPREKIIGKNLWEVNKEAVPLKFYTECHRAVNENIAVHFQEYFSPLKMWVEVNGYPSEMGLSIYFKDITDRINTFEKLEKSEIEVRHFAKQINKMLEDERSKIAHEIHDEFGQQLVGIKMSLSSLKNQLAGNNEGEMKVSEMVNDINSTIQSLRKFATELRLGILDTLGLISSIEWLVKEFEKKSMIKCRLDLDVHECAYDKTFSTNIFRICQEALTNIFKHAEATEVCIKVKQAGDTLCIKIGDNGIGIDNDKLKNPFSIGLIGMRQRADLVGASLDITSELKSGTCIQLIAKTNGQ